MMQQQTEVVKEEGDAPPPEYVVDIEQADFHGRALGMLIASRRCYESRQADPEVPTSSRAIKKVVKRIADHCNGTPDYLLPDTPLKEAVFTRWNMSLSYQNKLNAFRSLAGLLWLFMGYPRKFDGCISSLLNKSGNINIPLPIQRHNRTF